MPTRNLHTNPALGANSTGWGVDSGTTTRVTVSGFDRPDAFQVTATGSGDLVIRSSYGIAVTPSTSYAIYTQGRCSAAVNMGVTIDWFTSGDGYISSSDGTYTACAANTVETRSGVVTSPGTAAKGQLTFLAGIVGVGATLQQTCALVEAAGSVTGYADGETASWVWDGTRYNSTSTFVPPVDPLRLPVQVIQVP